MPTKLGQNFLKDNSVVDKIIQSADLQPDDLILEIGPGKGILTEELLKHAGKVIAIEIDKNLIPQLRNKVAKEQNVEIINGDILNFDISKLISNFQFPISNQIQNSKFKIQNCNYKVVANIPYYITSKIIRLFLELETPPQEMILMVQKEVAERIVSSPGKMSILAVSVQYYADAKILFDVPRENFDPMPEVDSAVIKIAKHKSQNPNKTQIAKEQTKHFFKIVKAGFSAKRKTLINNLSNGLRLDKKEVEEKLNSLNIKSTARAQELSVEDWKKLELSFRI